MKTAEGKSLVILSPGFAANESDTTCLPTIQEFVLSLKEEFPLLPITVIAFHYPFQASVYKWKGVSVIATGGGNRPKLGRLKTWWKVWRTLRKLYAENRNMGILSLWYSECSLVGKLFARRNRLKHFCWLQGQDVKEGNPYISLTHLQGKELIAMSDFLADEMERNFSIRPHHVIPNGIRVSGELRSEKDIDVLGVGSLIPLKRWHLFIYAIAVARQYHPRIRAVIAGSGAAKSVLEKWIRQYGLEEHLELKGEIDNQSVIRLMERSQILLHPSGYEGFGRVCIEALAAGASVISFCRPINRKIEGWHIVNTLAEMEIILKEQLMSASGRRQPVIPFEMKDSARKIIELF